MTFDLDIWHAGSSRSSSKVNVIGQNSRSHDEKMARSNDACYNVTNYRLFVELFCAKVVSATSTEAFEPICYRHSLFVEY